MEHEVKYISFFRDRIINDEVAVKVALEETGWKDCNVEVLPDEVIDTREYSFEKTRIKGNLRLTRVI